jgi:hypothetical protein
VCVGGYEYMRCAERMVVIEQEGELGTLQFITVASVCSHR